MNPTSAGALAQVIAVLVLAVAFAPTFRGSLPTPRVLMSGARVYREVQYSTRGAWVRVVMTWFSVWVLMGDVVIVASGVESDAFWVRASFTFVNAVAVGGLGGSLLADMMTHHRGDDAEDAHSKTTDGDHS